MDILERILEGQDASATALIDNGLLSHITDRLAVEVAGAEV